MNPFDFVNALNSKQNLLADNPDLVGEYPAFLVNRAFSYHLDTIFQANRMNMNPHLDSKMQWDFYYHAVVRRKRYGKWHKPENSELIDAIKWLFSYSAPKAKAAIKLLNSDDIEKILAEYHHREG